MTRERFNIESWEVHEGQLRPGSGEKHIKYNTYIINVKEECIMDIGWRLSIWDPVKLVWIEYQQIKVRILARNAWNSESLSLKEIKSALLTLYNLNWFSEGQRILGWWHALATWESAMAWWAAELLLRWRSIRWILLHLWGVLAP